MDLAVVGAAQRDSEFVAGFAAERAGLQVPEMMRIRWLPAAEQTCLLGNIPQMLPVAVSARCRNGKDALVDASWLTCKI
jgi:hypothetical protein